MSWQLRHSSKCASALRSTGISRPSSDSYIQGAQRLGISLNRMCQLGAQGRLNCVFPAFAFRRKETVSAGMRMREDSNGVSSLNRPIASRPLSRRRVIKKTGG